MAETSVKSNLAKGRITD